MYLPKEYMCVCIAICASITAYKDLMAINYETIQCMMETLEQAAQRSCECPTFGSVQGQTGWSFEHLDLGKEVPAHGRGLGFADL